ncbi:MAG: glycosyltransferase family 9 protein [Acidobacteriota bacterium]|nr:glycosyltransferase family 9 protein [Acidobacteriota bacterium]MDH3785606.1 glycosyltransferase family 9 protein [Acidobacteriota bacterium]
MTSIRLQQVHRRTAVLPGAGPRLPGVRRLLAIRHDRLGDLVLTLPALASLRSAYPDCQLACMVAPEWIPIAQQFDPVDAVLPFRPSSRENIRTIREFRPDLAICMTRSAGSAWQTLRGGVPQRVGTSHRLYSPLFHHRVDRRRRHGGLHEVDYARDFAMQVGGEPDAPRFPWTLPESQRERGALLGRDLRAGLGLTDEAPLVVLHAGSGGSCPTWPVAHHRLLGQRLTKLGFAVVHSMGPAEATWEAEGLFGDDSGAIFRGGLQELCGLVLHADAVVGSSTGPIHVAAALGRPVLAIHGPWPTCGATRWGPYSVGGWAVIVGDERDGDWSRRRRRRDGQRLLGSLTPEDVVPMVEALIAGRPLAG